MHFCALEWIETHEFGGRNVGAKRKRRKDWGRERSRSCKHANMRSGRLIDMAVEVDVNRESRTLS